MTRILRSKRLIAALFAGVLVAAIPGGEAPPTAGGPGKPLLMADLPAACANLVAAP